MTTYNDKINEIRSFAIDRLMEIAHHKDIRHEETYDLHNIIFNESYYIVGYYQAQQWIGSDAFRMIGDIQEAEKNAFGENHAKLDNAEVVANHWAYWQGHDIIGECHQEVIDTLHELIITCDNDRDLKALHNLYSDDEDLKHACEMRALKLAESH